MLVQHQHSLGTDQPGKNQTKKAKRFRDAINNRAGTTLEVANHPPIAFPIRESSYLARDGETDGLNTGG
jgi:hypothetical protein